MSDDKNAVNAEPENSPSGQFKLFRVAFKMQLFANKKEEYKKRHDEIWPELVELLKQTGIK